MNFQQKQVDGHRYLKKNRACKQCNSDAVETLCHFLYRCNKFTYIRNHYVD